MTKKKKMVECLYDQIEKSRTVDDVDEITKDPDCEFLFAVLLQLNNYSYRNPFDARELALPILFDNVPPEKITFVQGQAPHICRCPLFTLLPFHTPKKMYDMICVPLISAKIMPEFPTRPDLLDMKTAYQKVLTRLGKVFGLKKAHPQGFFVIMGEEYCVWDRPERLSAIDWEMTSSHFHDFIPNCTNLFDIYVREDKNNTAPTYFFFIQSYGERITGAQCRAIIGGSKSERAFAMYYVRGVEFQDMDEDEDDDEQDATFIDSDESLKYIPLEKYNYKTREKVVFVFYEEEAFKEQYLIDLFNQVHQLCPRTTFWKDINTEIFALCE
jgi:hypothetical protein